MRKSYPGIITKINGANPGPASGITYEVSFDRGNGEIRLVFTPKGARHPDTINTVAAPVGTPVSIYESQNILAMPTPFESFEIEVCEEPEP